ncbi:YwmB family TATA-box binding protein [Paenibacillus sp. 19GGS1-52]|uniref:YwmB family TATA-box binding protein n=1 Tax=Paenibacillus sp. 19GGS1-52 TaxID=2758563 RepID=UPI001EFAEE47|nr:YwmB family TATA-box binding protein [Paenibacillus sp. 19GGS1-52]ULO08323.1 YwmB family TATA-box binding protein [Paenibacillus sp. 19GGS1-52]
MRERNRTRTRTRTGAKGKLLMWMCITIAMLVGFRYAAGTSTTVAAANASLAANAGLNESLLLLSSLGQEVTMSGTPLRLVMKWQGEFIQVNPDTAEAAQKLSAELGLGEVSQAEEDGHMTYRAVAAPNSSYRTSMFWSELGNGSSYVIVTLETADLLKATGLQNTAEEAGVIMHKAGITAEWNVSLQGIAKAQGTPQTALNHSEESMVGHLSGIMAVESYEDETTYSRSYAVPGFERYVSSGDHAIALQAAIHKNGNDERNRITLGFPLITIEY